MFSGASLYFKYIDTSKKGKETERELLIVKSDLEKIMKAYESILNRLGAKVNIASARVFHPPSSHP
jgi:hypothetical protein